MPKVQMPKSNPSLDMTPMVDLAFLLVTFFMLTSSFRTPEPVLVDPPTSTTQIEIPKQVMLITVDQKGRAFIDLTNPAVKSKVFEKVCKQMDVKVSAEDVKKFAGVGAFGLKAAQIPDFLEMESADRTKLDQPGVPYDTTGKKSELYWWAYYARIEAHNDYKAREEEAKQRKLPFDKSNYLQFAVKADGEARYDVVKHVIQVFRDAKVKQFQMITGLEAAPAKK